MVRGQFIGYREEEGVAKDSDVETFCALRLFIDSWRWAGVPWYLRSGKCLAESGAEVLVELKAPPQALFSDSAPTKGRGNYLRFRLSPNPIIALAVRVKHPGEEFVGDQRELMLLNAQPNEEQPYERLLDDAMAGNGALFTARTPSRPPGLSSILSSRTTALPSLCSRQLGTRAGRHPDRAAWALAQPRRRPDATGNHT